MTLRLGRFTLDRINLDSKLPDRLFTVVEEALDPLQLLRQLHLLQLLPLLLRLLRRLLLSLRLPLSLRSPLFLSLLPPPPFLLLPLQLLLRKLTCICLT